MRVHEKDTELKIPNWYMKLPQSVLNRISDMCVALSHFLNRKNTRDESSNMKTKFYL